jgi:hypothetical protein
MSGLYQPVECRIRDLVVGDRLTVFATDSKMPLYEPGPKIIKIERGPDETVVIWFDNEQLPFRYDGRHGLNIIRTREQVVGDLVRVLYG